MPSDDVQKAKCYRRFRHKPAAQLRASAADDIDWEAIINKKKKFYYLDAGLSVPAPWIMHGCKLLQAEAVAVILDPKVWTPAMQHHQCRSPPSYRNRVRSNGETDIFCLIDFFASLVRFSSGWLLFDPEPPVSYFAVPDRLQLFTVGLQKIFEFW